MKTVIYARKSRGTIEELQNQIDICKDFCKSKEYEVSEIFSEIKSSQDFSREYYCKMLKYIKEHDAVRVVCTDLSRLNRNLVAQIKLNDLLIKHSSIIETVNNGIIKTDSPENKMMNNIIANFDEYYFNLTKQKMHKGLIEARKKGIRIGSKPYGYDIVNKRLVVNPMQSDVVKRVYKLIADGVTTAEVVRLLKQEGITTNTGRFFDTRAIRLLIKNEGYTGKKNNNIYPPIISRELYLEANSQLKSLPNKGNKRSYSLSGKIICSHCNNIMTCGYKRDRDAVIVSKGMNKTCDCMSHRYDYLEAIVKSDIMAYIECKLAELYQKLREDKELLSAHNAEIQAVKAEVFDNKEKLSKLNNLYLMNNISQEQLTEKSEVIKNRINLLELKQQRLEGYSLFKISQDIQDRIVKLEELKADADINDLVTQLVDHVEYYKDSAGISVNTKFKE